MVSSNIKRQTHRFAESPFVIFENLRARQMYHHFLIRGSGCRGPSTGVADQAASFERLIGVNYFSTPGYQRGLQLRQSERCLL